jgi:hypothetical protein
VEQNWDDVATLDENRLFLVLKKDVGPLARVLVNQLGVIVVPESTFWEEIVNRLHLHLHEYISRCSNLWRNKEGITPHKLCCNSIRLSYFREVLPHWSHDWLGSL